jgi:hypothetical protein
MLFDAYTQRDRRIRGAQVAVTIMTTILAVTTTICLVSHGHAVRRRRRNSRGALPGEKKGRPAAIARQDT